MTRLTTSDINLSARAFNVLKYEGIEFVDQMLGLKKEGIRRVPNCGENTTKEIMDIVEGFHELIAIEVRKIQTIPSVHCSVTYKNKLFFGTDIGVFQYDPHQEALILVKDIFK